MTAPQLLSWIAGALLLQLTIGVGVALRRREPPPTTTAPAAARQDAWPGTREFRVTAREFEDEARSQCSFWLAPADGVPLPAFKPGQYLTFNLRIRERSGFKTLNRCYSLSEAPQPGCYRITVKRVGEASSYFHDHVTPGTVLHVRAPAGNFVLDTDASVAAVLVAGGIGITPMMSMLRWSLEHQPHRRVILFYGVRASAYLAFAQTLQDLARHNPNFTLHVAFSRPADTDLPGRDYQRRGHVDIALLRQTLPHGRHAFYVCGPGPMMQTLVPALIEWGVPKGDIHFEPFGPACVPKLGVIQPAQSGSQQVRFQRSARTLTWTGEDDNLLEFSERHGITVDSGCRSGSCGSCATPLVSGEVAYARELDFDPGAGMCLLCVGRPRGDLVLGA